MYFSIAKYLKYMGKIIDLSGIKYNRLTGIKFDYRIGTDYFWICRCDCGNIKSIKSNSFKRGDIKSCGCLYVESRKTIHVTHGEANKSKEYRTWLAIKRRCLDKNDKRYHDYGGRGITICIDWTYSYENFLLSVGRAPTNNHSIDRIDVNGNYEPGNVRWSTRIEQQNNMRSNVMITYMGETKTLAQWCRELGLKYGTVSTRISRGWAINKALQ